MNKDLKKSSSHCLHQPVATESSCCNVEKQKADYFLWVNFSLIAILYTYSLLIEHLDLRFIWLNNLALSVFEFMNIIWIGLLVGFVMVAILTRIPREFIVSILGTHRGFKVVIRATVAGVFLDLCSHGILMVGAKLYERGVSIGQVMAFLIASPWNSFTLTIILITLIGLGWTLAFIVLSMLVAVLTGLIFDLLEKKGLIPQNHATIDIPEGFDFWEEAKDNLKKTKFTKNLFLEAFKDAFRDSKMVLRWMLFGVLLASLIRLLMSDDMFSNYFGPTLAGLGLTILVATLMEVCSEGSTPLAADLVNRAQAPGNSFAFLMTGVSTDYTEVMVLKEAINSWKIALLLPVLTLPQVVFIAWLMNFSIV